MPERNALQDLLDEPLSKREAKGYVHTAAEIASQPEVWRKSLESILALLPSLSAFCGKEESFLLTGT